MSVSFTPNCTGILANSIMAALNYPGPFCERLGILTDSLTVSTDMSTLPTIESEEFNKGVVLELNDFRKTTFLGSSFIPG